MNSCPFRVAVVTDEISLDAEESIRIAIDEGIRDFELRKIGHNRFPDFSDADAARLCELRERYGIRYTSVSPGWFKRQSSVVERALVLARLLGAERILIFAAATNTSESVRADTLVQMKDLVRQATMQGIAVSLENSANTCACSWQETQRVVAEVSPELCVNWDPGNAAVKGHADAVEGYRQLKSRIDNIHLKDASMQPDGESRFVPIGDGHIDYPELFRRLVADGYAGCVTIETHCTPQIDAFRTSAAAVRRMLEQLC